jgi:GAF domain-containing protein
VTPESGAAEELASVFARMSGLLLTEQTVATALDIITSLAVDTIVGSAGSGVSLLDAAGERTTSAATDPMVEQLDGLQYQLNEGPCLSAWLDQAVVRSGDLANEARWPSWSHRAGELGIRSVLSAPLSSSGRAIGAMKVYSTATDAYDERDEDLLRRFAIQASIFVTNVLAVHAAEHLSDTLKETLRTRDLLAMARGVVMARKGVGVEDANRHLIIESRRSRQSIREVAERTIALPREV